MGMACSLLVDRIDQIKRVPRESSLVGLRVHPDGKKFRAQVSSPRLVEAKVAVVVGIRRADIEAFVKKPLRRIRVRVNDEGGIVNLSRTGADNHVGLSRRLFRGLRRSKRSNQRQDENEPA